MMRSLSLLLALIYAQASLAAYAPTSIKGQGDASKDSVTNLEVPNKQATKTGNRTFLLENGNKNILTNPDFEHQTQNTGWTLTAGTFTADNTPISGAYNALITLSAQALEFYQDSTLYASQFADGVQGLASVRVRTTVSGIKVCSRQAGVTSTSNCVNVSASGKWGLYKIPFVLGATSNGISIHSDAASVTGDVEIDDAFVGPQSLTTEVPTCDGSFGCEDTFNARISSTGVVSGENISGWISSVGVTDTSLYTINFTSGVFTEGPNCFTQFDDPITTERHLNVNNAATSASQTTVRIINSANVKSAYPFNIVCYKKGADYTTAKATSPGFSTTNGNYSRRQYTPTFTGFGVVGTHSCFHSRDGEYLEVDCKFTSGSSTAVEARISLPDSLVAKNTGSSTRLVGYGQRDIATTQQYGILIEPSVSYFTIAVQGTSSGLAKANGSSILANGSTLSFTARIPIEGWENSNVIIGSFEQLAQVATIKHIVASGVGCGASTAGATMTRTLNTLNDPMGITGGLSSNRLTLPAGTYEITAIVPVVYGGDTVAYLYNSTSSAYIGTGLVGWGASDTGGFSKIHEIVTLTASSEIELRQYFSASHAQGWGRTVSSGQDAACAEMAVRRLR